MKKLIVALFATAFAFGVQAASVNWHFSVATEDVNYEALEGSIMVYFNDALLGNVVMDGGVAEDDFVIDDAGGTVKIISEVTNFADGAGTLEYSYIITSLPLPGYPDIEGSLAAVNGELESGLTNNYSIDISQTVADNGYSPAAPVIPEPTTGLLVLLGIAGLALKRKQA